MTPASLVAVCCWIARKSANRKEFMVFIFMKLRRLASDKCTHSAGGEMDHEPQAIASAVSPGASEVEVFMYCKT
jgi:hypothetical protein